MVAGTQLSTETKKAQALLGRSTVLVENELFANDFDLAAKR
jgi:hypothetical protein